MSAASPISKDGPSMKDEVLSHAGDTVQGLCKVSIKAAAKTAASPAASPTIRGKRAGKTGGDDEAVEESMSRCLVYCRLRPSNKRDFQDGATNIVALPNDHRIAIKDERHYDYDGTFNAKATQEDVFNAVAVPCIQHAFKGFCSALMCYGQTGTGKSYTMCNTDPANEGIIPRAAKYIFQRIVECADGPEADGRCYTVVAQFVQIYRDHLGDLMVHDGKDRVDIHYDAVAGVSLTGCSSHKLSNEAEFMRFYTEGNARRVVTATAMNPESSRGHTAMVVHIVSENPNDPGKGRTKGKITFIDLAGYERFSKTGITSDNPIMKDEAKTINASLLALGHVVSSLSSGSKHIPWRNSKLTRILQDSIGGRSRTSIILTIGPSSDHLYETTNSLQFGLRAMAVKVQAKVTVTVDYEKLSNKLMGLLNERDARINVLELQIASRDAEREELLDRYQQDLADLEARFESELQQLTAAGGSEEQIRKLKEVHNVEVQNLQEQQAEELDYTDEQHSKEINKLINEQKHQEAKSLTAMRLAQESIVEDFQQKLEHAREGTNDDLIHALQQLSEKDAVLATRAAATARLHAHIAALTEQVRSLSAEPIEADPEFPETYLDISQVEEMKSRLDGEVERLRNKLVDLQTQLDRVTLICSDRSDEIGNLLEENQQLRDHLSQTGAEMKDSTLELQRLKAKRAEMIDPEELETLRLRMQADIDELRSQWGATQAELERARDEQKAATAVVAQRRCGNGRGRSCNEGGGSWRDSSEVLGNGSSAFDVADGSMSGASVSRTALADDKTSETSSIVPEPMQGLPMRDSGKRCAGYTKTNQMCNVYKKHVKRLTNQLVHSCAVKNLLQKRVAELEELLMQNDVEVPAPPAPLGVPIVADPAADVAVPKDSDGAAIAFTHAPAAESAPCSPTAVTSEAGVDEDIAAVLEVRDDEARAHERVIFEQERLLAQGRSALDYSQRLVSTLMVQLQSAGLVPQEPTASLQPYEALPLDEYTALLRELRLGNRRLILRFLQRAAGCGSAAKVGDTPDGPLSATDTAVMEGELQERDNQLELKDELLLEKAAMAQYMAKISGRLISQMETLGLTPCCTLPESFQEIADTEVDYLDVQTERQRELEERLEREEEEKARMSRLLNALSAEREHQSLVLRQTVAKNKELEERQGHATKTIHRLAEEKTQREKILEETARRVTRELMETQARLAQSESERHSSVFDRLFKR